MTLPPWRTWHGAAIKRSNLLTFERDLPDEEVLACVCSVLNGGGVLEDGGGSGCLTAMADGESKGDCLMSR